MLLDPSPGKALINEVIMDQNLAAANKKKPEEKPQEEQNKPVQGQVDNKIKENPTETETSPEKFKNLLCSKNAKEDTPPNVTDAMKAQSVLHLGTPNLRESN